MFIADDDPDAHYLLKRQLARIGLTASIVSVSDGREAVSRLNACLQGEEPFPSLIFLDVKMPLMNGFEVLQWMGDRQLLGYICAVMLSSSDDSKDVRRAMALGAHTYLTKPAPVAVLNELIQATVRLGARKAASPSSSPSKVLLAHPASCDRRATRRLFEVMGYEVVEAQEGVSLIETTREMAPDYVFLDLLAAERLDCVELLAKLRMVSPNAKVLIAAATGQEALAQRALAAGAAAVVHKPLTVDKVAAILGQL